MNITIELGRNLDGTLFTPGLAWVAAYLLGKMLGPK